MNVRRSIGLLLVAAVTVSASATAALRGGDHGLYTCLNGYVWRGVVS